MCMKVHVRHMSHSTHLLQSHPGLCLVSTRVAALRSWVPGFGRGAGRLKSANHFMFKIHTSSPLKEVCRTLLYENRIPRSRTVYKHIHIWIF